MPGAQSQMGELSQLVSLNAGLYIVATPIGNLRDMTLRGLDILRSAEHIYAEDTRQTQKLLNAYAIKASLTAYHDHNTAKRIPAIIKQIEDGASTALVSDAGTPLVSDPGFKLVRAVIAARLPVIPVPGASAPLAGLVTSGLPSDKFMFAGFLPPKSAARKSALEALKTVPATLIFFETGPRIKDSLTDMKTVLGERTAAVARELTKRYEEIRRGSLQELIDSVTKTRPKGEIVVLVSPPLANEMWNEGRVDAALKASIPEQGVKRASAEVALKAGWAKRDVYERALKLK